RRTGSLRLLLPAARPGRLTAGSGAVEAGGQQVKRRPREPPHVRLAVRLSGLEGDDPLDGPGHGDARMTGGVAVAIPRRSRPDRRARRRPDGESKEPNMPMNGGQGIKQVGYFDCAGGGQVVVDGTVAFIAHMHAPEGTTIVDVSDPSKPRRLATIEVPPGMHS